MSSSKRLGRSRPPRRSSTRWSGIVGNGGSALPAAAGIHTSLLCALLLIARNKPSGASLMRASPPGITS
jgi:hypothetical protein